MPPPKSVKTFGKKRGPARYPPDSSEPFQTSNPSAKGSPSSTIFHSLGRFPIRPGPGREAGIALVAEGGAMRKAAIRIAGRMARGSIRGFNGFCSGARIMNFPCAGFLDSGRVRPVVFAHPVLGGSCTGGIATVLPAARKRQKRLCRPSIGYLTTAGKPEISSRPFHAKAGRIHARDTSSGSRAWIPTPRLPGSRSISGEHRWLISFVGIVPDYSGATAADSHGSSVCPSRITW